MKDLKKDIEFINKNYDLTAIPHDLSHLVSGSYFKKMIARQVELNASFVRILNGLEGELRGKNRQKIYMNKDYEVEPNNEGFDYFGFEKVFRPDNGIIKDRLRQYVDFFRDKGEVIDVGCGRGEFLELLKEDGIEAIGIDCNADMVARCEAMGLKVKEADVMEYMGAVSEEAIGGVFSSQFIEHIPFDLLDAFIKLSYKTLQPGGVFAAETINPYHPLAFRFFYVDPTHVKPLYPEVIEFLCKSAGFQNVKTKFLPPMGATEEGLEEPWDYADYAVIAEKSQE